MNFGSRMAILSVCALGACAPGLASTHIRHASASTKPLIKHATAAKPKFQVPRGIDDDRAAQLQGALIHSGYLSGQPSGHWDETTEAAMQKLQADNGWQTKLVPDSRAIIKLGLGPSTASPAIAPSSAIAPGSAQTVPAAPAQPNSMSLQ
jgi:hypothetical protein